MTERKTSEDPPPVADVKVAVEIDFDTIVPGGAQGGVIARARRRSKDEAKPAVARSRARVRKMFQAVDSNDGEIT